jgi:hypothetical protein
MKIAVVGGGMSGLIAAYVFQKHRNVSVTVYEPSRPAAEFLSGGLKYIHRTEDTVRLLHDHGVVFTNYTVRGGILLHGKVEQHPGCFLGMEAGRAKRIQEDHWRKTRRTEPGDFSRRSMNDPEASGTRRGLRCSPKDLVTAMAAETHIRSEAIVRIEHNRLIGATGQPYGFHFAIVTVPLWIVRRMVNWDVPEAYAVKLNVIVAEPLRDPMFTKWDYVYTPYTPANLIHRVSPSGDDYHCEFNGIWEEGATNDRVASDLNFLFPSGWVINDVKRGLNGHLLPIGGKLEWPNNIRPLGRYACWDPRATTDVTLRDAFKLAQEWGLERKCD